MDCKGELITLAGGIYKGRQEIESLFSEAFLAPYKDEGHTAEHGRSLSWVRTCKE